MCFQSVLGAILASFWEPFGIVFRSFFQWKMHRFPDSFWEVILRDFEGPDPRFWSSRLHETLIFAKPPFSPRSRFFIKFGVENEVKMEAQCLKKSIKKVMMFLPEKVSIFKPTWSPKGAQRDTKNGPFGRHFAAPPLDSPKGAKLSQNSSHSWEMFSTT